MGPILGGIKLDANVAGNLERFPLLFTDEAYS